jgi:hypothetical protein
MMAPAPEGPAVADMAAETTAPSPENTVSPP